MGEQEVLTARRPGGGGVRGCFIFKAYSLYRRGVPKAAVHYEMSTASVYSQYELKKMVFQYLEVLEHRVRRWSGRLVRSGMGVPESNGF